MDRKELEKGMAGNVECFLQNARNLPVLATENQVVAVLVVLFARIELVPLWSLNVVFSHVVDSLMPLIQRALS